MWPTDFPDSKECFPGVDIAGGVCYFRWDKQHIGECITTNIEKGNARTLVRKLNEFSVFVRYAIAVDIIHKVLSKQTDKDGRKRIISRIEVLPPNMICSESYLMLKTFEKQNEAYNLKEYAKTNFFRFLLSTILLTQNIAKDKFQFVPLQDFSKPWTDEELYAKYGLTDEEIQFIESMIRPME